MEFGGFVIHHKDCILRFIDRTTAISQKCNFKFNIEETEDYSWKIENFQKLHISFSFAEKVKFSTLLCFFNGIMLKEPVSIEIYNRAIDFDYYTFPEQFGSTKDNEGFGVFSINLNNITLTNEELKFLNKAY